MPAPAIGSHGMGRVTYSWRSVDGLPIYKAGTLSVQELWCHNAEGTEASVEFDLDGALMGGFQATRTRQGNEKEGGTWEQIIQ